MAFTKKTIKDISLKNKTVLVRADYNVPVGADSSVGDLYRVKSSIPTIQYLLGQNCKIVIISHLGRPEGKRVKKFSLEPVAQELSKLVNQEVVFVNECVGPAVKQKVESLKPKEILLLENLRFHPEEEQNSEDFAKELASLAQVFVQDGFGVVHRAHASTEAITKFLPSVSGLLLEKEVGTITDAMDNPERPLVTIVGGAKVTDKVGFIEKLIEKSQFVFIGGAMANTFLVAMGIDVGKSVYEKSALKSAAKILKLAQAKMAKPGFGLFLPTDGLTALNPESKAKPGYANWGPVATLLPGATEVGVKAHQGTGHSHDNDGHEHAHVHAVDGDQMILDIGPTTSLHTQGLTNSAKTIIWNGPLGYSENPSFAQGSLQIAKAIISSGAKSIVGGGDTAAFVEEQGLSDKFSWVSTGGGASLELMSGKKLPGVKALLDK